MHRTGTLGVPQRFIRNWGSSSVRNSAMFFWNISLPATTMNRSLCVWEKWNRHFAKLAQPLLIHKIWLSGFRIYSRCKMNWDWLVIHHPCFTALIILISFLFISPSDFFLSSEIPKTEKSFEERLIMKAFLLKFVNSYAPIFYVAFFKGR